VGRVETGCEQKEKKGKKEKKKEDEEPERGQGREESHRDSPSGLTAVGVQHLDVREGEKKRRKAEKGAR